MAGFQIVLLVAAAAQGLDGQETFGRIYATMVFSVTLSLVYIYMTAIFDACGVDASAAAKLRLAPLPAAPRSRPRGDGVVAGGASPNRPARNSRAFASSASVRDAAAATGGGSLVDEALEALYFFRNALLALSSSPASNGTVATRPWVSHATRRRSRGRVDGVAVT